MSNLNLLLPRKGVTTSSAANPLITQQGQLRSLHANTATGEIFTCVEEIPGGGLRWIGNLGTTAGGILSTSHADLLAMHTMDRVTGATLEDESANNNDLTITGAVQTPGLLGNALQLDGVDDYIQGTPPHGTDPTEFSVSWWAKADVKEWAHMFSHRSSSNPIIAVMVLNTSGHIRLQLRDSSLNLQEVDFTGIDPTDSYHHYVLNFNRSTPRVELFIDGASCCVNTTAFGGNFLSTHVTLGAEDTGAPVAHFDGNIDQVRFFSRILTQPEIDDLYNSGVGA